MEGVQANEIEMVEVIVSEIFIMKIIPISKKEIEIVKAIVSEIKKAMVNKCR